MGFGILDENSLIDTGISSTGSSGLLLNVLLANLHRFFYHFFTSPTTACSHACSAPMNGADLHISERLCA